MLRYRRSDQRRLSPWPRGKVAYKNLYLLQHPCTLIGQVGGRRCGLPAGRVISRGEELLLADNRDWLNFQSDFFHSPRGNESFVFTKKRKKNQKIAPRHVCFLIIKSAVRVFQALYLILGKTETRI